MAIQAQKIKLNMVPGGIIPVVHLSQNDIGRVLQFELYDGVSAASITTGTTVTVEGTKPDRHAFQYDATISGNVVTVNTVQQMVIVPGTVECTLTLTYSGQVIGTALFFMEVERSGIADNTDISETVLPVYMEAGRQYMLGSEAWAVGTKNGEPVGSVEPQYNNYSKYYADRAHEDAVISGSAMLIAGQSAESARESAVISGSAMRIAGQSAATAQSAAADALGYKSQASESAAQAAASAIQSAASAATSADAEAWAVGERAGQPVDPDDPTFHNNAKYYAGQAEDAVEYGIVDMTGATATTNGAHGAAPQPVAGQQNHYLKGDGTWSREDMTVTEITDSAPYLYRASKGGDRQYDELVGGSVVWNQTAPAMSTDKWEGNNSTNVSVSSSDGIITATIINPPSSSSNAYRQGIMVKSANRTPLLANHKYLISYTVNPSVDCSFIDQTTSNGSHEIACSANSWNINTFVDQPAQDKSGALLVYPTSVLEANTTYQVKNFVVHDLTAMFGSTIADYIYAREIAETGSGIAWIKSYGFFSKDYYAYDTGSILSVNTSGHKLEGKNIFNPDTMTQTNYKNGVGVRDGNLYTITVPSGFSNNSGIYLSWALGTKAKYSIFPRLKLTFEYKGNGAFDCGFGMDTSSTNASATTDWKTFEQTINESNLNTIKFYIKNTVSGAHTLYVKNIMVTTADAENRYVPYVAPITYPLTPTDLRGILSLSGDELVYDGDVYESDGTETVKYGIVDLGTLTWTYTSNYGGFFATPLSQGGGKKSGLICSAYIFGGWNDTNSKMSELPDKSIIKRLDGGEGSYIRIKDSAYTDAQIFKAAMNGVYCIYELPTPTTATLSPFVSPQICDKDGTEEYIDTRTVPMPVGHHTEYYGVPEWLRDRYLDELRELPYKIDTELDNISSEVDYLSENVNLPVNPTDIQINAYHNGAMWVKNANLFVKMANIIHRIPTEPIELVFSSDGAFTLSVATPGWNGEIEYSFDGENWTTWDGSQLSGTATQSIYVRGRNNTVITGNSDTYKWTFTGKYVTGNIETLLDYETVANGQHPVMGNGCYYGMFYGCTSLTTAPVLPATTLKNSCYGTMFRDCTSLITAPALPATTLADYCYGSMFLGCTSLTTVPELPATTLEEYCYGGMFRDCTSLTTAPVLPATTLAMQCYYNMFRGCTNLKVRENGSGTSIFTCPSTIPSSAVNDMFTSTGGTFAGTPTAGKTYNYY